MVVQVHRAAEDADEDDLCGRVVVQRASDEEVGQREAPCGFRPDGREGGEGGGSDGVADVLYVVGH